MNIYAIRDRLIDYFMQPFAAPEDKAVLASVARMVNTGEITSDIAQAPHHYEIWKLGGVTEDGHLVPDRQLVADCASLVRPGVRPRDARGSQEDGPAAEIGRGKVPSTYPTAGTDQRPPQAAVPATADQTLYSSPPPQRPVS